ncbi:MAG: hypothetical protein ACYDBT_02260 [Desulfobulbaceae bacterium]
MRRKLRGTAPTGVAGITGIGGRFPLEYALHLNKAVTARHRKEMSEEQNKEGFRNICRCPGGNGLSRYRDGGEGVSTQYKLFVAEIIQGVFINAHFQLIIIDEFLSCPFWYLLIPGRNIVTRNYHSCKTQQIGQDID